MKRFVLGIVLSLGLIFPAPDAAATEHLFKLTPSDGTVLGHFGNHVAVSGDTAVVGAPGMHGNPRVGAAYVFTRAGDTWTEQAKLTPSDGGPGDRFGWSVAISGDTVVVSSLWDDVDTNVDQGSAYVFTRTAGTWTEQAKLIASDGVALDEFGFSVAISGDDVLVGAKSLGEEFGVAPQGSAYAFTRTGGTWSQQAKLIPSEGFVGDGFGFRVGIEGDTAVVGAVQANEGQGAAYVFRRAGGTWTEQAELTGSDAVAGDEFGFWLAVSGDTIVVGDPSDDGQGSAYVFTRSGNDWPLQERLTASDAADGDYFGRSVAVSGDMVVVGAQSDDVGPNEGQGSAYVFSRTGGTWAQQAHLIADDGAAKNLFGVSVGISGDTAVVGASFHEAGDPIPATAQGAAYVWRAPVRSVSIDIAPGDNNNRIRMSRDERIAVAVITNPSFDATKVDPATVCFGDAPPADADCTESHGTGHIRDVDGDGDLDMLLHFESRQTGIDAGDTKAHLTGRTRGGIRLEGSDSIRTVRTRAGK